MEITRHSDLPGGLLPETVVFLSTDFKAPLFNTERGVRHPRAIYNLSIGSIFDAFIEVLDEIDRLQSKKPWLDPAHEVWDIELLKWQEDLLMLLMSHFDDCKSIFKCFLHPSMKISKNKGYKHFTSGISQYRTYIGKIVNFIKHKQGKLRSFIPFNSSLSFPGFYIEGIDVDHCLGPALFIHKGGNTAFSFSRNLRYHFFNLYHISMKLTEAINELIPPSQNQDVLIRHEDDKVRIIARRLSEYPLVFFEDELKLPVPTVDLTKKEDNSLVLTTIYPNDFAKPESTPPFMQMQVFTKTDGFTQKFRLPYSP